MADDTSTKTIGYSSAQVTQGDSHVPQFNVEFKDHQNPSFKDIVRGKEIDDPETTGLQHGRDGTVHWGPGASPYLSSGLDDPNSSYPYLPPVLEEPSSSFSEGFELLVKFHSILGIFVHCSFLLFCILVTLQYAQLQKTNLCQQ